MSFIKAKTTFSSSILDHNSYTPKEFKEENLKKSLVWENINARKVWHTTGAGISHSYAVVYGLGFLYPIPLAYEFVSQPIFTYTLVFNIGVSTIYFKACM